MSVISNARKAAELAASVKLGGKSPHVTAYSWGIFISVDPWELVRIFNLLNVRKSALEVRRTDDFTHISFKSRGAEWTALIKHEELPDFYTKLSAHSQQRLTVKQPRVGVKPRQPLLIPPAIGGPS